MSVNVNSTQFRNLNVGLSWQANDGYPYPLTTGEDNNGDGILNDRPAGTGVWWLRGTPHSTISSRIAYVTPRRTGRGGARFVRNGGVLSVNNLTNRSNYGGLARAESRHFTTARSVITAANCLRNDVNF